MCDETVPYIYIFECTFEFFADVDGRRRVRTSNDWLDGE